MNSVFLQLVNVSITAGMGCSGDYSSTACPEKGAEMDALPALACRRRTACIPVFH